MKKIQIIFTFLYLLCTGNGFSVEIGDEFIYIRKILVDNKIQQSRHVNKIINYDSHLNMYLLRTEEFRDPDYPQEGTSYEVWYDEASFISEATIDRILKKCEQWEGKKSIVRLIDKSTNEIKRHDVCILSQKFGGLTAHIDGKFYYYGHFPIYGFIRADAFEPRREVIYDENLVASKPRFDELIFLDGKFY